MTAADVIRIREVGPRDGLQNESHRLATDEKIRLIEGLSDAGLKSIEATSFVRPDVIPQLADAAEVLRQIEVPDGVSISALVPNEHGLERALELRTYLDEVSFVVSASDAHNVQNLNRTTAESLAEIGRLIPRARTADLRCEAVISTAFGCPYAGTIDSDDVLEIAQQLVDAGADELAFADTTGMANPGQVADFFERAGVLFGRDVELTAHFHDSDGRVLDNVVAALQAGCTTFESSFGGLGGCPGTPGANGNVNTEDLVLMLGEMGIATGVDLDKLVEVSRSAATLLGRPLTLGR